MVATPLSATSILIRLSSSAAAGLELDDDDDAGADVCALAPPPALTESISTTYLAIASALGMPFRPVHASHIALPCHQ
eukprot:3277551-Rhodomonas_salina.2